ncbi:MAG: hypothetical protein M3Q61_04920 [Chloroflexota bacterium]|nr:hypothetical protein [Chloroflexota bacterium]
MTWRGAFSGLRPHAEMLRRKGRSIADAQRMPDAPEPWYMVLTWNAKEEASFERCLKAYAPGREWGWWLLCWGLHRRDRCTRPRQRHDEAREADLPRARRLPVRQAMIALPRDQWPGRAEGRAGGGAP